MAKRIIFTPTTPEESHLYHEILVDFTWVAGMAISQGQKSVSNLHSSALGIQGIDSILEISTRSLDPLGLSMSAFNLELLHAGRKYPVEVVYQSSKVFRDGGPYFELLSGSSLDAKRDSRLKSSGELIGFSFEKQSWPISSSPNFYDYLYIRALLENSRSTGLVKFNAFSDLAFNQITIKPKSGKSFNCQARSAAIYVSLLNRMPETEILDWITKEFIQPRDQSDQLGLF
jgi:type I restriction enzyme M protein